MKYIQYVEMHTHGTDGHAVTYTVTNIKLLWNSNCARVGRNIIPTLRAVPETAAPPATPHPTGPPRLATAYATYGRGYFPQAPKNMPRITERVTVRNAKNVV